MRLSSNPSDEKRLVETIHGLLQEDLIMSDPCMVLGKENEPPTENLLVICPGKINYCPPADLWTRVSSGFKGTIFITAELSSSLDLDRLSQTPDVQIVIYRKTDIHPCMEIHLNTELKSTPIVLNALYTGPLATFTRQAAISQR